MEAELLSEIYVNFCPIYYILQDFYVVTFCKRMMVSNTFVALTILHKALGVLMKL
jgi:hypothetical protein